MSNRVLIFRRSGPLLAEIEPEIASVSWRLNEVGQARFTLPWSDEKCTRGILQFGNLVLIQFGNGLPDWGGVIDTPRHIEHGVVGVTAYSGEKLLSWRVTEQSRNFDESSPGTIFRKLIEDENAVPTGITPGSVYSGGALRSAEYHYQNLLSAVQELAALSGNDFAIAPVLGGGSLSFAGNWYERRGADRRTTAWLIGGENVQSSILDEQGEISNRVILAGEGTTWTSERTVTVAENSASRNRYGYREYAEAQSGVGQALTLAANAAAILEDKREPYNRLTLSVLDTDPAGFAQYDVGDLVTVRLFTSSAEWAFEEAVRVLAREFVTGQPCRLEVEQWPES